MRSQEATDLPSTPSANSRRSVLATLGGIGTITGCLGRSTGDGGPGSPAQPNTAERMPTSAHSSNDSTDSMGSTTSPLGSPTSSETPTSGTTTEARGTYTIERVSGSVPLTGEVDGTPWASAAVATLDTFRWVEHSRDAPAEVRVLYDEDALYCQFHVPDDRIEAEATALNDPVFKDSAVEWFFDPDPATPAYCNVETNCVGTLLASWRRADVKHRMIGPETAAAITVETSVAGPRRTPSPSDESWWLAMAIPYDAIETLSGTTIAPATGDRWRGNFHRINSESGADVGVWNPIETPSRELHRPDFFGELIFA